jgi:osmotically-inducible protein OsmY
MQPDAWVTAKIQSKYFLDDDVKGRRVDVDTNDGVVTLRGTVNSESQRRQAVALARNTDGVVDVRDELTVNPAAEAADPVPHLPDRSREAMQRGASSVNDTWITTKIQSKFFLDNAVKGYNVNVDTSNGVVTLKGQVESEAAKQAAESIAKDTEGVTRVVNQLTIVSGNTPR